jgi:vesicle coat complex subunit
VDAGLRDPHPYVRDAAVMGVLKYHAQDAGATRDRGLPDRVRAMLEADQDPQVS